MITPRSQEPATMADAELEVIANVLPQIIKAGPNAAGVAVRLLAEVNSERRERVARSMCFGVVDHA